MTDHIYLFEHKVLVLPRNDWLLFGKRIVQFWLCPHLICKWIHEADLSSLHLVFSLCSRIPHLYTAIQHSRGVRFPDQNNSGPSNYWVNFVFCFHWGNGVHRELWSALRYNEGHSHQDIYFFELIRRQKNIYPELEKKKTKKQKTTLLLYKLQPADKNVSCRNNKNFLNRKWMKIHHLHHMLLIRLSKVSFYHRYIPAGVIGIQLVAWDSCLEFPWLHRYKHR